MWEVVTKGCHTNNDCEMGVREVQHGLLWPSSYYAL